MLAFLLLLITSAPAAEPNLRTDHWVCEIAREFQYDDSDGQGRRVASTDRRSSWRKTWSAGDVDFRLEIVDEVPLSSTDEAVVATIAAERHLRATDGQALEMTVTEKTFVTHDGALEIREHRFRRPLREDGGDEVSTGTTLMPASPLREVAWRHHRGAHEKLNSRQEGSVAWSVGWILKSQVENCVATPAAEADWSKEVPPAIARKATAFTEAWRRAGANVASNDWESRWLHGIDAEDFVEEPVAEPGKKKRHPWLERWRHHRERKR